MIRSSLRLRLAIAALISIIAALSVSGVFLQILFERHVERRLTQELSAFAKQLAATLNVAQGGAPRLSTQLADPRFRRPFSGLYWQIAEKEHAVLHSRSLWDQSLPKATVPLKPGSPLVWEGPGPNGEVLLIHERRVFLETPAGDRAFRLSVAVDKRELTSAAAAFLKDLAIALGLLGLALAIAAWMQIAVGLAPLNRIRQRINDIRTGQASKLSGEYPNEVQALVRELNALLEARDLAVTRARDAAGDLAHGLKTPLAVLQAESRALRESGRSEVADEIEVQVEQMRQRVERHLAVARLRGPGGAIAQHTHAASAMKRIVAAMARVPQGQKLEWYVDVPDDCRLAIDGHDFAEVFGNLLDNAGKWAKSRVSVRVARNGHMDVCTIEDDGPGVPSEKLPNILGRGEKLDESKQGSGLGLSIVQEILNAYGADLQIENVTGSGLRATVRIPVPGAL